MRVALRGEHTSINLLGNTAVSAISANDSINLDGVRLADLAALLVAVEVNCVPALRALLQALVHSRLKAKTAAIL